MGGPTFAAWAAHLYTALGLVAAALAAFFIMEGGEAGFRAAFALLLAAGAIDATDGWLARRARVNEHAPTVDGRRLDDIIDFQTYTVVPLLLIWRAELLPPGWAPLLLLPLLASAYGFAQTRAKTEDGFFLGFPSYWNILAFYLYFLAPPAPANAALIVSLAVLTFVPSRYLYPSRGGPLWRLTTALGALWAVLVVLVIAGAFPDPRPAVLASFVFPAYYMAASWFFTVRVGWGRSGAVPASRPPRREERPGAPHVDLAARSGTEPGGTD